MVEILAGIILIWMAVVLIVFLASSAWDSLFPYHDTWGWEMQEERKRAKRRLEEKKEFEEMMKMKRMKKESMK